MYTVPTQCGDITRILRARFYITSQHCKPSLQTYFTQPALQVTGVLTNRQCLEPTLPLLLLVIQLQVLLVCNQPFLDNMDNPTHLKATLNKVVTLLQSNLPIPLDKRPQLNFKQNNSKMLVCKWLALPPSAPAAVAVEKFTSSFS